MGNIELDYDQQVAIKSALTKIAEQLEKLNRKIDRLIELKLHIAE